MKWKKCGRVSISLVFPWRNCREEKNTLSFNNSCPNRDSKVALPEYKSALLLHEPACSGLKNELL